MNTSSSKELKRVLENEQDSTYEAIKVVREVLNRAEPIVTLLEELSDEHIHKGEFLSALEIILDKEVGDRPAVNLVTNLVADRSNGIVDKKILYNYALYIRKSVNAMDAISSIVEGIKEGNIDVDHGVQVLDDMVFVSRKNQAIDVLTNVKDGKTTNYNAIEALRIIFGSRDKIAHLITTLHLREMSRDEFFLELQEVLGDCDDNGELVRNVDTQATRAIVDNLWDNCSWETVHQYALLIRTSLGILDGISTFVEAVRSHRLPVHEAVSILDYMFVDDAA